MNGTARYKRDEYVEARLSILGVLRHYRDIFLLRLGD